MVLVLPHPGVTASLKETLTCPQLSWAEATPVDPGVVSAGHSNARSAGAATVGGTVSITRVELLHVAGQPLLVTLSVRLNPGPQTEPALTVTMGVFADPEMLPLPEIDQEYESMPAGAKNWTVEPGQVEAGPEMEKVGAGATVSTTSLVFTHPFACTTVKRSVALGEEMWAVVFKLLGESIRALPETTLQVVPLRGKSPGVA